MLRPRDLGVAAGRFAVAVSGLLLGAAVASAVRTVTLPRSDAPDSEPTAEATQPEASAPSQRSGGLSDDVLDRAAERAPFSSDRQAASPYLLPEERIVPEPVRIDRPEPPPAPAFRVLGTVAGADGGIAVIEAPGEPPRVVTMGDEILGYRLSRIEQGRVVLGDGEGRSLSVAVPDQAPRTASATPNNTGRGGRNQNAAQAARTRAAVGGPANPAADVVNQAIARLREQSGGGDVRMEMRGDRVILTGADGSTREITIGGNVGRAGATSEWTAVPPAPAPPAARRRPGGGGGR
jgi:hypothetical protein